MSIAVLKLPDIKRKREERPRDCPYCEGQIFQRWGQVRKPVRDVRCRTVQVYRYRCCHCRRTFRHYPQGISWADQSERVKVFGAICWKLGLSYRGVSLILSGWEVLISHMSIWRDVQEQAEKVKRQNRWKKVRAKTEAKFGKDKIDELFPDSAYQLTHNALFPHDCIHVENLGGDIGLKELHNKRITLGAFPWKFKGGEAAFCRAVAFVEE